MESANASREIPGQARYGQGVDAVTLLRRSTEAVNWVELTDGTRLASWSDGKLGALPPVVLLHGGPGLWDDLGPLGELISDQTLVHRYDQRGCGLSRSGAEDTTYPVAQAVADLETLREQWHQRFGGHDRWVVIGHSFGAALALAYGAAHPDRIAAIGYLDGTGIGDWRTAYRPERDRRRSPWAERFSDLDARDRTAEEEVEWRALSWAPDYADPAAGMASARLLARIDLPINYPLNRSLAADPEVADSALIDAVQQIRAPSWFIHGSADPRPVANVVELSRHASRPRKRIVEGAGHAPWREQPDRVREILEEVLHSGTWSG